MRIYTALSFCNNKQPASCPAYSITADAEIRCAHAQWMLASYGKASVRSRSRCPSFAESCRETVAATIVVTCDFRTRRVKTLRADMPEKGVTIFILQRQDSTVPWGFRLVGGADFDTKLMVLRVSNWIVFAYVRQLTCCSLS